MRRFVIVLIAAVAIAACGDGSDLTGAAETTGPVVSSSDAPDPCTLADESVLAAYFGADEQVLGLELDRLLRPSAGAGRRRRRGDRDLQRLRTMRLATGLHLDRTDLERPLLGRLETVLDR